MDIKFRSVGMWYADEVAALVETEFGFTPEVSTSDGMIIVHPRPRALADREVEWLRDYLADHPQKLSEERMVEFEVAEEARRAELVAQIKKATDDSDEKLKDKDVRDALRAVAELAGIEL